jgi:broad specificity phosphatase PhoE
MKIIYFVRHGESEGNIGTIRQSSDTPLSPHGRQQAEIIAQRASHLTFDVIISSTLKRAEETAQAISKKTNKDIEYSDLFVERVHPVDLYGISKTDPRSVEAGETIRKNFAVPGFRYADEENAKDLMDRAQEALKFLTNRPEEHILVATHGFFLRIVMARAVFGDTLTEKETDDFVRTFQTENTGITVFSYDETKPKPWRVLTWNDYAHLAELEG